MQQSRFSCMFSADNYLASAWQPIHCSFADHLLMNKNGYPLLIYSVSYFLCPIGSDCLCNFHDCGQSTPPRYPPRNAALGSGLIIHWYPLKRPYQSIVFCGCSRRKINMEPENTPGKGKASSKPSFSGSMLIFGGVLFLLTGLWLFSLMGI